MSEKEVRKEVKEKKEQKAETKREAETTAVLRGKIIHKDRTVEPVELRQRPDGHWYTPDGREAAIIARIGDAEGEVR